MGDLTAKNTKEILASKLPGKRKKKKFELSGISEEELAAKQAQLFESARNFHYQEQLG